MSSVNKGLSWVRELHVFPTLPPIYVACFCESLGVRGKRSSIEQRVMIHEWCTIMKQELANTAWAFAKAPQPLLSFSRFLVRCRRSTIITCDLLGSLIVHWYQAPLFCIADVDLLVPCQIQNSRNWAWHATKEVGAANTKRLRKWHCGQRISFRIQKKGATTRGLQFVELFRFDQRSGNHFYLWRVGGKFVFSPWVSLMCQVSAPVPCSMQARNRHGLKNEFSSLPRELT